MRTWGTGAGRTTCGSEPARLAACLLLLVATLAWPTTSTAGDDRSFADLRTAALATSSRVDHDVVIREFSAADLDAGTISADGVSAATLSLLNGRFSVSVTYRTASGQSGSGMVVPGVTSADSGLFYFFGAENWELLVKAVSLCGLPGTNFYTVIAAAATDVEFRLVVTDNVAGITRTYENPLGTKAVAVRDSFATCGSSPPPPPPSCSADGPITDLTRDCQRYAYFYRRGNVISGLSSNSRVTAICASSLGDSDILCYGGPVQGPTNFSLVIGSLNQGPELPLGAGSGGNISGGGRTLNYTVILRGERFDFIGSTWVETRPINSTSGASSVDGSEAAVAERVGDAVRRTLAESAGALSRGSDAAAREFGAVLSVQQADAAP